MGNMNMKCCNMYDEVRPQFAERREQTAVTANGEPQMVDLKAPITIMTDKISSFEADLPFNRISVDSMMEKIALAEKSASGEGCGFVTLESLSEVLTSPAWAQLKDLESTLAKVLLSDVFKETERAHAED